MDDNRPAADGPDGVADGAVGRRASMLGRAVLDLALRPVAVAVAAPSAAWALAGGLVRVAVRGPDELRRTLELLERAQGLLTLLEPPVRRAAAQVDDRLVDDLVLSARAAPALVATAADAVGEFQRFVDYAQGARAAADQLLADLAGVLRRTEAAVGGTERVLARVEPVVGAAEGTVGRADAVVRQVSGTADTADGLVRRVSGTVDVADALVGRVSGTVDAVDGVVGRAAGTVDAADALVGDVDALVRRVGLVVQLVEALEGTAQRLVDDAVELAGRARPAVEQAADLGAQLVDPAAALVPVVRAQAPAVAGMLPDLVRVLGDLLQDLPELLRRIDQDVLPTLRSLRSTPGDVRALRDTVADIEPLVGDVEAELAGLPGSGLLRRRGRKADDVEPAAAPAPPAPQ